MADVAAPAPAPAQTQPVSGTSLRRLVGATEIDLRLFGMLLALIGILVGFHIMSGGTFIRPANMVTLAVQATGIAIMATGMVLIIVSRNIDLSVGSIVGLVAMSFALLQTDWLPALGLGDSQWMWLIALGLGLGLGAFIGGVQGFIIAYIGVPSFIVTLGGLLSLRGTVWLLSSGAGINGLQTEFRKIGGGVDGSVGEWATWLLAVIGSAAIIALIVYSRRQRQRFGFPVRPMWAEVLIAVVGCIFVLGIAAFANMNYLPPVLATQYALEHGITEPAGGLKVPIGLPWPIILVVFVTIAMTFVATRRRFGRYVYAYGGNPDAAELAGINTRWTIMKTFMLMGFLCAIAAAVSCGPSQRGDAGCRTGRRALRHRRGGGRWGVVRRRHRHDSGCRAGRVRHGVAVVRPELQRRERADPGRGGRARPDRGGRLRHLEPPTQRRELGALR